MKKVNLLSVLLLLLSLWASAQEKKATVSGKIPCYAFKKIYLGRINSFINNNLKIDTITVNSDGTFKQTLLIDKPTFCFLVDDPNKIIPTTTNYNLYLFPGYDIVIEYTKKEDRLNLKNTSSYRISGVGYTPTQYLNWVPNNFSIDFMDFVQPIKVPANYKTSNYSFIDKNISQAFLAQESVFLDTLNRYHDLRVNSLKNFFKNNQDREDKKGLAEFKELMEQELKFSFLTAKLLYPSRNEIYTAQYQLPVSTLSSTYFKFLEKSDIEFNDENICLKGYRTFLQNHLLYKSSRLTGIRFSSNTIDYRSLFLKATELYKGKSLQFLLGQNLENILRQEIKERDVNVIQNFISTYAATGSIKADVNYFSNWLQTKQLAIAKGK